MDCDRTTSDLLGGLRISNQAEKRNNNNSITLLSFIKYLLGSRHFVYGKFNFHLICVCASVHLISFSDEGTYSRGELAQDTQP